MVTAYRIGLSSLLAGFALAACDCKEDLYVMPGKVVGTVCANTSGAGLKDAKVIFTDAAGADHETTTDAAGVFHLDQVAPGPGTLTVDSEEQERSFDLQVISEEEVAFRDERCHAPPPLPTGAIAGCICDDARGAWVEGANVFVATPDGQTVVTGTAGDGCFLLEGVPVGSQVVQVQKDSFYVEKMVDVQPDGVAELPPVSDCSPPPPPPPPPPGETGNVQGRVCAPDGSTWLADAAVWVVLADGSRVQVTTDADGNYLLEGVPVGSQTLHIQKGSFSTTVTVVVPEDGTVTLPEADCAIQQVDLRIAVVSGRWDNVRQVLIDVGVEASTITDYAGTGGLFTPSTWAATLLGDYAVLSQFDIVFLNCGLDEVSYLSSATYAANLRQFVTEGGSVYVSDQAYDVVEKAFPDFVDFLGDDATAQTAQDGDETDTLVGSVSDTSLAAALGQTTIDLNYPLAYWSVMESVSSDVRIYIRGDAPTITYGTKTNVPHTVGFTVGEGKVIYTSFHQEPGIAIAQERVLQLLVFEL